MNSNLSEDQRLLVDAVRRYVDSACKLEDRSWGPALPSNRWSALSDLGILGLPFDQRYGGGGRGWVEVALVMQQFGRALINEPYVPCIVMPGALIEVAGDPAQRSLLLPRLIDGSSRFALAYEEASSFYDLSRINTYFVETKNGYVLNGSKIGVLTEDVDTLIVLAKADGPAVDEKQLRLFLVPGNADGLRRVTYPSVDGAYVSEYILDDIFVSDDSILGNGIETLSKLEHALDIARVCLCAEAVGIMESVVSQTTEYAKARKQFGVPIGSLQSIQRKMADMLIYTEQAKSSVWRALSLLPNCLLRAKASAGTKALVSSNARFVGQQAVKIHRDISDEMRISRCFNRLTAIEQTLGNAAYHIGRLAHDASFGGAAPVIHKTRQIE